MNICLISFDYWNYDQHIVAALKQKGITANHIDINTFTYHYSSRFEKIKNFFTKLIFNKNIKKIKRNEFIINELNKLGKQDAILVIRPDLISLKTHFLIKQYTTNYIAYIYDSCKRFPVDHLLNNVFNTIYSFDLKDVKKYHFKHIPNYIYLPKKELTTHFKYDVFIILSIDERLALLNKLAAYFDTINVNYKFMVVNKKKPDNLHKNIEYTNKEVRPDDLKMYLNEAKVFLDLVRHGHNGLSFRIFEALAYQRKVITSNPNVKQYDFYSDNNFCVINDDDFKIPSSFFKTDYQKLPKKTYQHFTIDNWVSIVFDLQNPS